MTRALPAGGLDPLVAEGHDVLDIEHPTGYFSVTLDVRVDGEEVEVEYAALLRTARLLMRGDVFVPSAVWPDA